MYNELEFIVSALVGFTGVSFCFFPKHLSNRSLNKLLCVLMILSYLVSSISKPKKVPDELCTQIIQTGVNISAIFYLMGLWTAYKYAETIIVGDILRTQSTDTVDPHSRRHARAKSLILREILSQTLHIPAFIPNSLKNKPKKDQAAI